MLIQFIVPRWIAFIEGLQISANDPQLSWNKRMEARNHLLEAQNTLKAEVARIQASKDVEDWALHAGMRVRLVTNGEPGAILGGNATGHLTAVVVRFDNLKEPVPCFLEDLKIDLPPGIYKFPY